MTTNAVPKQLLSKLLRRMLQVIPSSSPKEVLTKIKLVFSGSEIRLYGTDLEQFLVVWAPCQIDEPGMALVNYADFRSLIGKLTGQEISLSLDGNAVIISDDHCSFQIQSHTDIGEFPVFGQVDTIRKFTIPIKTLCYCFSQLVHCTDKESTRYALNSINMIADGGVVKMQSSDGRRAALLDVPGAPACEDFSILIPTSVAKSMPNVIDGEDGDCQVLIGESRFGIETENMSYDCRLNEGRFPAMDNFRTLLKSLQWCEVDGSEIRSLAAQALAASTSESRAVSLELDGSCLSATGVSSKARFASTIPCKGSTAKVQVNAEYLGQAVADCENVRIGVDRNDKLCVERDGTVGEIIMGMAQ